MSFVKYVEPSVDFGESPAVDMFGQSWAKLASSVYVPAEVEKFLKTAKPVDGHRLLLVHGMGSSEIWGANRNGDAFPEMWKGAKNLIEDSRDYGYKTFEKNAHTFRDHRNHDPKLTIGGKVVLAAWNDKMHRVELIIPVSEKLAPDVVDAIDKGEKIAVSMGCRVPHDVCSICGNQAKHRGHYCKHAAYQMNEVLDDGRKVYVDNPQPNFFDISVLGDRGQGRPADASAYSIMKVAGAEVKIFRPGFKAAEIKASGEKKSEIEKQVPATGVPTGEAHQEMPDLMELIKKLLPFDMDTAGDPSVRCVIMLRRGGKGDDEHKTAMLSTLTAAGIILRPRLVEELELSDAKIDFSKVSAPMLSVLRDEMPNCSLWLPYFGDRAFRNLKLATAPIPALARNAVAYNKYLGTVKTAVTTKASLMRLVQAIDASHSLKMAIARDDLAELNKFAGKDRPGISGENLAAALLGPMLAGAYFRSQQYSGQPVGPVRGFVADHPMMTGVAAALLWHKLKGGRIPLVQS